jgi:ribosomal protein S3AE
MMQIKSKEVTAERLKEDMENKKKKVEEGKF